MQHCTVLLNLSSRKGFTNAYQKLLQLPTFLPLALYKYFNFGYCHLFCILFICCFQFRLIFFFLSLFIYFIFSLFLLFWFSFFFYYFIFSFPMLFTCSFLSSLSSSSSSLLSSTLCASGICFSVCVFKFPHSKT